MASRARVLFIGDSISGAQILDSILEIADLVAIAGAGESDKRSATRRGIPFLPAVSLRQPAGVEWVSAVAPVLIVNFNSLTILPPSILAAPQLGAFNLHPGRLPEYAGMWAWQWAIIENQPTTAATLHEMIAGVDTGDIVGEAPVAIDAFDTGLTLYLKLLRSGARLVIQMLPDMIAGKLERRRQPLNDRRYFSSAPPFGGIIDPRWDAQRIERFVRALSYRPLRCPSAPPQILTSIGAIEIAGARVADTSGESPGMLLKISGDGILIACGRASICIQHAYLEGTQTPAATLPDKLGVRTGNLLALSPSAGQ